MRWEPNALKHYAGWPMSWKTIDKDAMVDQWDGDQWPAPTWHCRPSLEIEAQTSWALFYRRNFQTISSHNKARDLIVETGLVILLQLASNCRFFYRVIWKFEVWPRKIIGHLFYATSSFVNHFTSIGEFKLELQSGNSQFGSKKMFCPVWPPIWQMTLKNNRIPLSCYLKLFA